MNCGALMKLIKCNVVFSESDLHIIATACLNGLDYYHSQGYLHCVSIWREYHLIGYFSERSLFHRG